MGCEKGGETELMVHHMGKGCRPRRAIRWIRFVLPPLPGPHKVARRLEQDLCAGSSPARPVECHNTVPESLPVILRSPAHCLGDCAHARLYCDRAVARSVSSTPT